MTDAFLIGFKQTRRRIEFQGLRFHPETDTQCTVIPLVSKQFSPDSSKFCRFHNCGGILNCAFWSFVRIVRLELLRFHCAAVTELEVSSFGLRSGIAVESFFCIVQARIAVSELWSPSHTDTTGKGHRRSSQVVM